MYSSLMNIKITWHRNKRIIEEWFFRLAHKVIQYLFIFPFPCQGFVACYNSPTIPCHDIELQLFRGTEAINLKDLQKYRKYISAVSEEKIQRYLKRQRIKLFHITLCMLVCKRHENSHPYCLNVNTCSGLFQPMPTRTVV